MKIGEIRKKAIEKYKKHPVNSWVLSIICGLFIAALLLVGILSEVFLIFIVPLIILPFLFACIVSHFGLQARDELSGKGLFRLFSLYFQSPFNQSFGVLRSFVKALLIELVSSVVVSAVCYTVFSQSPTFIESINSFIELFRTNSLTTENMQTLLNANGGELYNFVNLTNGITFLICGFAFIVFILREAITIYTRLSLKDVPLANQIARATMRVNNKHFNMAFFALNWPMLVLIVAGMVLGMFVCTLGFDNYIIAPTVSLTIGVALTCFFLPFYFSNMESIYDYLAIDINSLSEEYVKEVFQRFGVNIEIRSTQVPDSEAKSETTVEAEKKNDPSDEDRND